MKNDVAYLEKEIESLNSSEQSERKNIQFTKSETVIGNQPHFRTLPRIPDEPVLEDFDLKIPDKYNGKIEILMKTNSCKRFLMTALKIRREEVEQLNGFITELFFKSNSVQIEESNVATLSRKIIVRTVKLKLKEIKNFERYFEILSTLDENLANSIPNALHFCKCLCEKHKSSLENKVIQLQEIFSRLPKLSDSHTSEFHSCKEVCFDVSNIIQNEMQELQQVVLCLVSEENESHSKAKLVCSRLYLEMIERRKQEFDVLVTDLDLLDNAKLNGLNNEDAILVNKLREAFLTSIIVRENEVEWLGKEINSGKDVSERKSANIVVCLKDLFCAALELEKRHYEKILLPKKEESFEVIPISYSLKDLFDIVAECLKRRTMPNESVPNKKLYIQTHSLEEFFSALFDSKQNEIEIPLHKLKEDLEEILTNMVKEIKEQENKNILESKLHIQALKISNSWKEIFLAAADIRRRELAETIPAKIKNLKEEQANINCDMLSKSNYKGKDIALFWQQLLLDVVSMKKEEIKKIQQLLNDPHSAVSEVISYHIQPHQPTEKGIGVQLQEYNELLNSIEHKRMKQPTYYVSDWDDIIAESFFIEQLEAAKITTEEKSISLDDDKSSKYNLVNVFKQEPNWDEIFKESLNVFTEEKELSLLLQLKKTCHIPLVPWTDVFKKAVEVWEQQVNTELHDNLETEMDAKQEEYIGIKELQETISACISKQNSMTGNSQNLNSNMLWENIFQESVNVITKSEDLGNILKTQDLKLQYQAARIHSPWNDYFIKIAQLKMKHSETIINEHVAVDELAEKVHKELLEESSPITKHPTSNTPISSWTTKPFEEFDKLEKDLNKTNLIKESELVVKQQPDSNQFVKNNNENTLLKVEPEKLISHGKKMFLIALELRKAKVKAMKEELRILNEEDSFQEKDSVQSLDNWKKVVSIAVDQKVTGKQPKQSNKRNYLESSEKLFFLAAKSLRRKLEVDSSPYVTVKESENFDWDNPAESTNWEELFQNIGEFILIGIQSIKRLGLNEVDEEELLPNKAVESLDDDIVDLPDWIEILLEAIEKAIKENNPNQIIMQDILEKYLIAQPLPSWNEIFFMLMNFSNYGIQDKLNSDSYYLVEKEDSKNVKLLAPCDILSWDDILIATLKDYLQEPSSFSNFSYDQRVVHSWICMFPSKSAYDKYQAKEKLLEEEIELLQPSSVIKPDEIPNDIMWKHVFPMAVIVWRKKMEEYLNSFKKAPYASVLSNNELNIPEAKNIKGSTDLDTTQLNKSVPSHPEHTISATESFDINIPWREVFFAALERKKTIIYKLIGLKESESINTSQKTSSSAFDRAQSITFTVNSVLDLPITPHELIEAYKILKLKNVVHYNEKEPQSNIEANPALQMEDIKPFDVIKAFGSILLKGLELRSIETSVLEQELSKIKSSHKENKKASSTLKALRMYYNGAIEFRQKENKNIDFELATLKDVKDIFLEYVSFSKTYAVYQRNQKQESIIIKAVRNLQEIESDFQQKLVVHLNQCVLGCKELVNKKNDPNLQIDMKTMKILKEKNILKGQNILDSCVKILETVAILRKEELKIIQNELELMQRNTDFKCSLEIKVSTIFIVILNFLLNALLERNNSLDLLSNNIQVLKQIEGNMNAKVENALICCKDFFSKAIHKRKSEITAISSELECLKGDLKNNDQNVLDIFSSCENYCEKATYIRNLELQKIYSYLEQISTVEVIEFYDNCRKYFSTSFDKRKQESQEIQTLMEPLKQLKTQQGKCNELSSELDEVLCKVFGIEPESNKSMFEIKETEQTNLNEEPIEILGNFISKLIKENETIKHEIKVLETGIKNFKTCQKQFEIDVNSILTMCQRHFSLSLDNTKEEIDEINFQLEMINKGLTEDDALQFENLYSENILLLDIVPSAFKELLNKSPSNEGKQLSQTFIEVAIKNLENALKWRKDCKNSLIDNIKFLLDYNDKPIKILISCEESISFIKEKRKQENQDIYSLINSSKKEENRDCEECLKEILYLNDKALYFTGKEHIRFTEAVQYLQKEKSGIFSLCEGVISCIIHKREEEMQAMTSDLSNLQIIDSSEDSGTSSNLKNRLKSGIKERENEVQTMKKDLNQWSTETEILPIVDSCKKHLNSCLENKEAEVQNILKLLKSLKEEGNRNISLHSPILESILNKNNADYEGLQLEISKFDYSYKELNLQCKRIVEACQKLYCCFLENFEIEIEGILCDLKHLEMFSNDKPKSEQFENQQATVNFKNLFTSLFNLKKKELQRDVHRAALKDEIHRKQLDIMQAENPEIQALNDNKGLQPEFGAMNAQPSKTKRKQVVSKITSLTQLNTYFDKLKEKKNKIKGKLAKEFRDELNYAVNQEIYYEVPPQSQVEETGLVTESSSKTETFTNRVYEIKLQNIEDDIKLKRYKILNVILKRKSFMDTLIASKRQEMENCILCKETKIRQMRDSVCSEDSQVVCSLKDIFQDIVKLKNKEKHALQNRQQLDKYRDHDLEDLNVLVNFDDIFSVALSLKDEEIEMIKYSNNKEIERCILVMKKECETVIEKAKRKLEKALVKYRDHEKSKAQIYTGLVSASKNTNIEEYVINDEEIFPDIKAFEDYISSIDKHSSKVEQFKKETSVDVPFHIPHIRPHAYALHGVAGHLLNLYKDEVESISQALRDITNEIDHATKYGINFKLNDLPSENEEMSLKDNKSLSTHSIFADKKEMLCDVVSILNSNTSMLMVGSSMNSNCGIALNLGNEFGLVYFEKISRICNWNNPKPDIKEFDWDVTTVPLCSSRFQRFISDVGLLEQIRFILLDLHHQHLFCRKCNLSNLSVDNGLQFETLRKFLSATYIEDALQLLPVKCGNPKANDINVALYAIKFVLMRGALLTSICLAAILEQSEEQNISIITNSPFIQKLPEYQTFIKTFTSILCPDKTIDFLVADNVSCGIGSAMAACVTFNSNNQHPENVIYELQSLLNQNSKIFHINSFMKTLESTQTLNQALKLAYQYLEELNFDLPISVVWAYYFMNERYEEAKNLFKENIVSLREVNSLICENINSTSNIELYKMYKDFVNQNCKDNNVVVKMFQSLFDFLIYRNLYDEAVIFIKELTELGITVENLKLSSLAKLHEFWLKNKSSYENISAFFLPLQNVHDKYTSEFD
ncbi:hypothetical protein JTE90_013274 [Oedothorax gibbosus]|uniref:Hexokinase C-terminal domain-containing protein n=1 Tax=Oedothorax gibbosus TaxID=931172 RepID=A0AAV6VF34_9ARAC|nr:hypothetical protein JTE90_013274 [Oedothorax gibbosus]